MKKFKLLRGYVRPNTQNVELDIQREITSRILRQSRVMISVMNRHGYGSHMVVSPELARRLIGITEE
jgi:hypothetical protein